jgi:hypothetical protein
MDTPKSLRERAQQWRTLAGHHSRGTADALIEAACDLEVRARSLELARPAALAHADQATSDEPAPRRSWRFVPRRLGSAH